MSPTASTRYTLTATSAEGSTTTASTTVTVDGLPLEGGHNVGINLFYNAYWDFGYVFADLVKQSVLVDDPPLGADGWPTGEATYLLLMKDSDTYDASGTYKLHVDGPQTLRFEAAGEYASAATITNRAYANGHHTADVTLSAAANELQIHLYDTGTGFKNLQVFRPGHDRGDVFAKEMLDAASIFTTIRPMQMVGEPTSRVVNWAQRRSPLSPSQANVEPDDHNPGIGVSYEYLVMLANTAHKDLWLCLPRLASEAYVRNVANLVRYGSDGTNPYTSPQASPVFPPLDPDLHLYVEFSNEIWNYSLDAERDLAVAEVRAGDANHLDWDGTPGLDQNGKEYYWAFRRTGYKALRISEIFRSVFGDDQMPQTGTGRIRPVLAGQIDRYPAYATGLLYVDGVYGPGNGFGNPGHPMSYYFWAVSGAPYPTLPGSFERDDLTVDDVFAGLYDALSGNGPSGDGDNVFGQIDKLREYADRYGLHMVAYEGGQSLWRNGHSNSAKAAAQLDDRMQTFTEALLEYWFASTDDVFIYFTMGRAGDYFSLVDKGYDDLNTPKWRALEAYASP